MAVCRLVPRPVEGEGERTVKQALRRTLLGYKLHRDQELFEKAYGYIKQYY